MTIASQPSGLVTQREPISLPLLRPVLKPAHSVARAAEPPEKNGGVPPMPTPKVSASTPPPALVPVQKLNLDLLEPGDRIVVRTANSTYNFEIEENHFAKVTPGKPQARTGRTLLMGGTNDDATEHTPNTVVVGGRLAYQFPDEDTAILTSVVESILRVAAQKPASA